MAVAVLISLSPRLASISSFPGSFALSSRELMEDSSLFTSSGRVMLRAAFISFQPRVFIHRLSV